jgi:hypothetical protein
MFELATSEEAYLQDLNVLHSLLIEPMMVASDASQPRQCLG